jgi:hypothetical protein
VQALINFMTVLVSISLIGYFELSLTRRYDRYYNDYQILPRASDYSVMVEGLPRDITISEIENLMVSKIQEGDIADATILKVYLIYNLKTYYALYANKRTVVEQMAVLADKHQKL